MRSTLCATANSSCLLKVTQIRPIFGGPATFMLRAQSPLLAPSYLRARGSLAARGGMVASLGPHATAPCLVRAVTYDC